jgi:8-oxo-dGTP pyrophosphatase MutT (NUDIX family)
VPISPYLKSLRSKLGPDLLVLPAVSLCLIDAQSQILLVHSSDSHRWNLPGGAIEPLEHPAISAIREMREETGLDVVITGIRAVYGGPEMHVEYPNGGLVSYVTTIFSCRATGGHLHPEDGEALDVGYFAQSEAENLDLAPWTRTLLPILFNPDAPPYFSPAE